MARAQMAAPRSALSARQCARKPPAWVPLQFGSVRHLSSFGSRSSSCDASETAFPRKAGRQRIGTARPSSRRCLVPQAGRAVHPWQGLVACGEKIRSEEHTSELQSRLHLVCRLLLEKKKRSAISRHSLLSFWHLCISYDSSSPRLSTLT